MVGRYYSTIVLRRRKIGIDRLDRSAWRIERLEQKVDSHLLLNAYGSEWTELEPLLNYMYYYLKEPISRITHNVKTTGKLLWRN